MMSEFDQTEHEVAVRAESQRKQAKRDAEDFKRVMQLPQGRAFIWKQLERAGVFRAVSVADHAQMAFAEGQRNNGLYLLAQIDSICPELYDIMRAEARNRSQESDND